MLRRIQLGGQWLFLRVEGLFNLAFGDRLNPLYYLGAISYFMFWVVIGSGLYLYVFFETGVNEAYDSVQRLTLEQWYLGGVMRSLHRYASDAMVLTMVLHLTRHFTFGHHRGFRWFSWVTGIVLLWLVYAAGINGYMLPWDSLAQFVVIATAEWFDWLPLFKGALIRNFIQADAVNDRLFSLLAFVHIGIPLGTLALLWVHTHRVPNARTSPPRPIAATLMAALIVLSLVKPAVSQEHADLAAAVTTIGFDWFYLPVYALLYRWTAAEVWTLVGGATALLFLLPWLPPRFERKAKAFSVLVHPDNRIVPVRENETFLDAGLREGLALPFECRYGGCGVCKARLLYGTVDHGACQPAALTQSERREGKILLCSATPLSDVEIEYVPVTTLGGMPVRTHAARVQRMARLADNVMQVFLKPEGNEVVRFYAGQYINIILDDGERRSFSFATAPQEAALIELHIRRIPGGRFTTHVFTGMKVGDVVRFEGPLGSFFLREDSAKPIIFVAGATGFAPVKSMVEYAFRSGLNRRMILYWGARARKDLYLGDLPARWEKEHENFKFVPVLSDPEQADQWTGRTGLVHEAILQDFPDLGAFQIYACGSVEMVAAAHPAFLARGLKQDDCFSDAFKLVPHLKAATAQADMVRLGGGTWP
ncbi:MAG: cytochrome b N-terminal domain-containing protein [Betaproteobacteria bacterium]